MISNSASAPTRRRCAWRVSQLAVADPPTVDAGARDLLISAVREAGALALKAFRGSIKQWAKGKSSVVCEVDLAVDKLLRERLTGSQRGYGWLSEETEDDPARLDARTIWIVDPIDGTRSYLAGRVDWSVSAALAVGGRPGLAALFSPPPGGVFFAAAGGGGAPQGGPPSGKFLTQT